MELHSQSHNVVFPDAEAHLLLSDKWSLAFEERWC
jgi:hypothetical protein